MAEATGSLSFWDLVIEVATRMYCGIQSTRDWPTETELAGAWALHSVAEIALAQEYTDNAKAIVNAGYKRFLIAHDWGFLTERTTLTGWTTVTETESAVGGPAYVAPTTTITVDTAMFLPSMVGQTLTFGTSGTEWVIASVTSTTVALVTGDASGEAGAQEITVTATGFQRLPDDFGGQMIDERMYFAPDGQGNAIREALVSHLMNAQSLSDLTAQYPYWYGLETVEDVDGYTRWNVLFYPQWASDTTIHYRYRKQIAELTSAAGTTDYPLGGAEFSTAIREACLMMVEEGRGYLKGPAHDSYNTTLAQAISRDSRNKPRNRGYNGDNSGGSVRPRHPMGIITFNA